MKNKKKIATLIAATGIIGAIGIGSTLAYFTDSDAATNIVEMGNVDISLWETSTNGTGEPVKGLTFNDVMPGDTLAKDPYIIVENNSADCYLRIKLNITSRNEVELTDEQSSAIWDLILGQMNDNGWTAGADDYFYYQLNEGVATANNEKYPIFDQIVIPESWDNSFANLDFTIQIDAEAIQAANFDDNLYRDDEQKIYAWFADDLESINITFGNNEDATTLLADANGNVTLPVNENGDGWYDSVNLACYRNGSVVSASDLAGATQLSSVSKLEDVTFQLNCHDVAEAAGNYFHTEYVTFAMPVFEGEQKNTYVQFTQFAPEIEGYSLTSNGLSLNGKGVNYLGGQTMSAKGFYINTDDRKPVGPGKYEQYTSIYRISNNGTCSTFVRGYDPDYFVLLCNYSKN